MYLKLSLFLVTNLLMYQIQDICKVDEMKTYTYHNV